MSKRKLTRRQAWRVAKIQEERQKRAEKRERETDALLEDSALEPEEIGLVTAHFGVQVEVVNIDDIERKDRFRCHMRANLGSLVTGDRVVWRREKDSDMGVIVAVQPRESELTRPDSHGALKTVAANINHIIIVFAPYPEPHSFLIDRYLVAAETLGIRPVLLLNKIDSVNNKNRASIEQLLNIYRNLDYPLMEVSTKTGEGMETLKDFLADQISVFVGQSGVGKSSLVNKLLPTAEQRVGALSEARQKGTHTTTTAQLFHFPAGGDLIDSPGIREFGLWHMDAQAVLEGFTELRPFIGHCKFRDCRHEQEPHCAILKAVEDGHISAERIASYRHIIASLEK
ncbi:small ribosomal subunit biogenesis GTPase RsgA [Marinibactrum halimedae]|nr:small ribosomal subunit biogenesis GTPase RsgA [Marinibactrum halimedae]MCD9459730.1 small ribosomal subunit biogenesis GTPase RsgA [Marinibactrum halimedae]